MYHLFHEFESILTILQVQYNDDGLTALIFTSEGDMRQAINNLQSTCSGFGFVSGDHVFKVCDQPHPVVIQAAIKSCLKGDVDGALEKLKELWDQGYSAVDIVVTLFRVVKSHDEWVHVSMLPLGDVAEVSWYFDSRVPEHTKLEYIKVRYWYFLAAVKSQS